MLSVHDTSTDKKTIEALRLVKDYTPFFLYKHNDYKHIEAEISLKN